VFVSDERAALFFFSSSLSYSMNTDNSSAREGAMYLKRLLRNIPEDYSYWNTVWFGRMTNEYEHYHYTILMYSFALGASFPLIFLVSDLMVSKYDLLLNYTVPLVVMSVMMLYLHLRGNISLMSSISLLAAVVGFFCAVFLPGSRGAYIFIVMGFVPLAYELKGIRTGRVYSIIFLCLAVLSAGLMYVGLLPRQHPMVPWEHVAMGAAGFILLMLLVESGERQHEKQVSRVIRRLIFDSATGLPNKEALMNSMSDDESYLFGIISIDNFKELSTLFGFPFSESIITFAAGKVRAFEKKYGYRTYKLMYHEFGILMKTTESGFDEKRVEGVLASLWESIQGEPLLHEGMEIHLNYRIGGIVIRPGETAASLSRADMALISGRRSHRPVTVLFDPEFERNTVISAAQRFHILSRNREEGTFRTYLQPVHDISSGDVRFYECLLRIKNLDGSYGSIHPYLSLAESIGCYDALTRSVLRGAEEALMALPADVSINISHADIARPGFLDEIVGVCRRTRGRPGRLVLEVIEKDELVEVDNIVLFFERARAEGCLIAVDDFGSGFSNYANLLALPIDIIKIDGGLVKNMPHDENALVMVESIAGLCRRMNKLTVAEFVENGHILDHIRNMGVDMAQGYHLGHPEPLETFLGEFPD